MAKKPEVGEIRIGRAGNKYNRWNGKRWIPVSAARTAGAGTRKASVVSKPVPKKDTAKTQKTTTSRRGSDSIKSQPVPKGTAKRTAKVENRPRDIKGPSQLVTSKDGSKRWVKQVTPKKSTSNVPEIVKMLKKYDDYLRGRAK